MANLEVQEKDGKIYCPLKGKWLIAKPEEKVRQKFIATLVNEYGYTLDQMAQELELTGSKRGKGHAFADIVIWKSKADKDAMKEPSSLLKQKLKMLNFMLKIITKEVIMPNSVVQNFL